MTTNFRVLNVLILGGSFGYMTGGNHGASVGVFVASALIFIVGIFVG